LSSDPRRYALRISYRGEGFSGSQRQPDERTVEGEFLNALGSLKIDFSDFKAAGRTDRGVSALGNVFAITTDSGLIEPRIANSALPGDIRVLAAQQVALDFNPRHAVERVYKHFLADVGYDTGEMKQAAMEFIGEKSFHNFSQADDRNPVRRINGIAIEKKGEVLVLTISGESFLWQMVRRMTTALKMAGRGEISAADLRDLLNRQTEKKISPSAPENLVLWDTRYSFNFNPEEYSRTLIEAILKDRLEQINIQKAISTEALNEIMK
jgi:tRNA pseudouridine38-40 synthase